MLFLHRWWPALCWALAVLLVLRAIPQYAHSHRWRDAYMLMYLVVTAAPFILLYATPVGKLLPLPLQIAVWVVAGILAVLTVRAFIVRSRQDIG